MSIEKRVSPFSRAFRSLIKTTRRMPKPIKDLKALRLLRVRACYRHSGPTDLKRTRDVFSGAGTLARDRPSPYDEGRSFVHCRLCSLRAPTTVVCDRLITNGSGAGDPDLQRGGALAAKRWRGKPARMRGGMRGPKPYDEGGDFRGP